MCLRSGPVSLAFVLRWYPERKPLNFPWRSTKKDGERKQDDQDENHVGFHRFLPTKFTRRKTPPGWEVRFLACGLPAPLHPPNPIRPLVPESSDEKPLWEEDHAVGAGHTTLAGRLKTLSRLREDRSTHFRQVKSHDRPRPRRCQRKSALTGAVTKGSRKHGVTRHTVMTTFPWACSSTRYLIASATSLSG